MKFDFKTPIDRTGHDAISMDVNPYPDIKIKEGFSKIPMWVADMNFPTAPSVQKAMIERIQHPTFGYFPARAEYFQSIIDWHRYHFGVDDLKPECIGHENGVLGGLLSALGVYCSRGDKVLVHAPTYVGFTKSMENVGYEIVHSHLVKDRKGIWRMDFADMEKKLKSEHIHAAIFCSPHNPCGRVWEKWELEKAFALYQKYDVKVVSDEIWANLTLDGYKHIPSQSVSEYAKMNTVAMYAPTKTFNLAGLVGSYHVIYNPTLCDRVMKESSLSHYNSGNVLSMYALLGAYSKEGNEWLQELRHVLTENADYACNYIKEHFKGVSVARPQGTYMLFADCTEWCEKHGKTIDEVIKAGVEVGVIWQDGRPFHGKNSIRINIALQRSLLEEALQRLDKYVFLA
ncbi:MAG: aminotransferase class I/II-fold pyridoxal phosphate-dependent enzyme [Schaedlerella sp.]|nr:aminotransferase class I/II-fold pyridoxal phosphate-dependent enzyme [Schaedlerella sp.]